MQFKAQFVTPLMSMVIPYRARYQMTKDERVIQERIDSCVYVKSSGWEKLTLVQIQLLVRQGSKNSNDSNFDALYKSLTSQ